MPFYSSLFLLYALLSNSFSFSIPFYSSFFLLIALIFFIFPFSMPFYPSVFFSVPEGKKRIERHSEGKRQAKNIAGQINGHTE
jgi:hypothetical protein